MGREIIHRKKYRKSEGYKHLEVVLAEWRGEFVTWVFNKTDNGYHHGHYFQEYTDALLDFDSRGLVTHYFHKETGLDNDDQIAGYFPNGDPILR